MESPGHHASAQRPETRRDGAAFDYEKSLARLGGDPDLFREIVSLFLEDSPELVDRARRTLRERDFPELERAAHSLKGLSVNFDAQRLAAAALCIEQHAHDRDFERAAACFPDLEQEYAKLQSELLIFQRSSQARH